MSRLSEQERIPPGSGTVEMKVTPEARMALFEFLQDSKLLSISMTYSEFILQSIRYWDSQEPVRFVGDLETGPNVSVPFSHSDGRFAGLTPRENEVAEEHWGELTKELDREPMDSELVTYLRERAREEGEDNPELAEAMASAANKIEKGIPS